MKPIILLIIIFFIWRHFKKKKANKAERQASSQSTAKSASGSSAAASKSTPVSAPKNAGPSTSSAELHFDGFPIYTPEIRKLGPCRGTPVSESNLPKNNYDLYTCKGGNDNPDYDFACARKFFNKYTEKWKEGKFDINPGTAIDVKDWLRIGVPLARYYETGWGCDQDPRAALAVLQDLEKYMTRQTSMGSNHAETEEETEAFCAGAEAYLALGECYACLGQTQESEKYYRMAMAFSRMFKYPEIFERKILNSALGGFPVPANPTLAAELALKLVQQNKAYAGYTVLEARDLLEMDYQKIGQSPKQDFQVYLAAGRKNGSGYAAYKLGECYLYGIGTEQDVHRGLSLLHDASYSNSLNATTVLRDYLGDLSLTSYRDENGKKLSSSAYSKASDVQNLWDDRADDMEEDSHILSLVQSVIDQLGGAENLLGKRATMQNKIDTLKKSASWKQTRIKELDELLRMADYYKAGKPVADKLKTIRFEKSRQKYKAEHDEELRLFYMAERKLKGQVADGKLPATAWCEEKARLETEYRELQQELTPLYADTKKLWAIHYSIYEVQHEQERQNAAVRQKKQEIEH